MSATDTVEPIRFRDPLAWPGHDDYERVTDALGVADEQFQDLIWALERLLDSKTAPSLRNGCPVPELATVAELARANAYVELIIDSIKAHAAEFESLTRSVLLDPVVEERVGEAVAS